MPDNSIQRPVLLHAHLFKNAGSTIDWALRRSFGRSFAEYADDRAMQRGGMPCLMQFLARNVKTRVLSSHCMPIEPSAAPGSNLFWIVMLRDPLDRIGSVYTFDALKRSRHALRARMAAETDIRGYVQWALSPDAPTVIKNFQTRYLAGARSRSIGVGREHLRAALDVLSAERVAFGMVERFDESMVVFEERLRPVFPEIDLSYVVRNYRRDGLLEKRKTALQRELGDDLYQRAVADNVYDIELHNWLSEEHRLLTRELPDFDAKLAEFRARCGRRRKMLWALRDKIASFKHKISI